MKTKLTLIPLLAWLAILSQNGPARAADNAVFPLKVSANGRYLVDQNNAPFLIHGDSPWSLIAQLSEQDTERYLDRIRQQGFNAIIVNLVEYAFSDNAPRNHAGIAPFTTPGDFSTPNEAYFVHADWVLGKAKEKGLLVLLFPTWAAGPNAKGGWNREIVANGAEKCRAFGRYAGNRYKDFPNIIWGHGGDQNPASDTDYARNMLAMALGIRDAAPGHLQFYHGKRGKTSLDQENSRRSPASTPCMSTTKRAPRTASARATPRRSRRGTAPISGRTFCSRASMKTCARKSRSGAGLTRPTAPGCGVRPTGISSAARPGISTGTFPHGRSLKVGMAPMALALPAIRTCSGSTHFSARTRGADAPLTGAMPAYKGVDGTYAAGDAFPIASAELKIGDQRQTKPVATEDRAANFTVVVKRGRTELQTWFRDAAGKEIAGAYYVHVRALRP